MQLLQGADAEVREQAGQAITGLWKRQGLLGIPIYAGGHWTLLVLRRSGGSEFKMFQEEFVEVRYYESLQGFSEACWNVAEKVLKFILPTHSPKKGRANNTYQGMSSSVVRMSCITGREKCDSISARDGAWVAHFRRSSQASTIG